MYSVATPNVNGQNQTSPIPAALIGSAGASPWGKWPTLCGSNLGGLGVSSQGLADAGQTCRKYQPYIAPSGQAVGVENSSTATRPPGRQTRTISRSPASVSADVSQAERRADDLKRVVGKRQPQGVGFDQGDPRFLQRPRAAALFFGDRQHRPAEIGADDGSRALHARQ